MFIYIYIDISKIHRHGRLTHGDVYLIQHYVIKFVGELR